MNFRVGQKVVCIDASGIHGSKPYPVEGNVYEISASELYLGTPAVKLRGFAMVESWHWLYARRFRPVVERKTNISIFRKMLTDAPVNVGAL